MTRQKEVPESYVEALEHRLKLGVPTYKFVENDSMSVSKHGDDECTYN